MPVAEVYDINMYYEVQGDGEPLILIMGLGGDLTRWFRILPLLTEEFKVITFDNRGAGRSEKPDRPYSMELMADDIAGLMRELQLDKAHIFGISMGGMIAQVFALRHPDKVISLMLGCTRCGGEFSVRDGSEAMTALNPELVKNLSPADRARNLLPFLYSRKFIDDNPGLMEEMVSLSASNPIDPVGYSRQMQATNEHDTYERLPEVTSPTLVITGDADRLIPAANSPILAARIPGAELVILEGMGHGFYTEAREETARILIDFMKKHGR